MSAWATSGRARSAFLGLAPSQLANSLKTALSSDSGSAKVSSAAEGGRRRGAEANLHADQNAQRFPQRFKLSAPPCLMGPASGSAHSDMLWGLLDVSRQKMSAQS